LKISQALEIVFYTEPLAKLRIKLGKWLRKASICLKSGASVKNHSFASGSTKNIFFGGRGKSTERNHGFDVYGKKRSRVSILPFAFRGGYSD